MWKRGLWLFALLALLPSFSASASDDLLLMNTAEAYESYLARLSEGKNSSSAAAFVRPSLIDHSVRVSDEDE